MRPFLAAFRAQLRLRLRAPSTWALAALGLLLTCWGTLLDILAVGVEEGRPLAMAHTSGGLLGLLWGGWIGSGTPRRYSLDEARSPWAGLVGASWAIPAARCAVASLLAAALALLCVLYTLVLAQHISIVVFGVAAAGAAMAGGLAAAWAAFLTRRVGPLPAVAGTLALAFAAATPIPPGLRAVLPTAPPAEGVGPVPALVAVLAASGLLSLTPGSRRADGRAEPAS